MDKTLDLIAEWFQTNDAKNSYHEWIKEEIRCNEYSSPAEEMEMEMDDELLSRVNNDEYPECNFEFANGRCILVRYDGKKYYRMGIDPDNNYVSFIRELDPDERKDSNSLHRCERLKVYVGNWGAEIKIQRAPLQEWEDI